MAASAKKVLVYSTPTCPHCKRLKQFLKEHEIPFEERDGSADKAARDEMVRRSGPMGGPVIDIDGSLTRGFDEAMLRKELGI